MVAWIVSNWVQTVGVSAAVLGALWWFARLVARSAAQGVLDARRNELAKDLASYKAKLEAESERLRAKHGRELTDFAHYAKKRHEAIQQIFASCLAAEDEINKIKPRAVGGGHTPDLRGLENALEISTQARRRLCLYLPRNVDDAAKAVQNAFGQVLVQFSVETDEALVVRIGTAWRNLTNAIHALEVEAQKALQRADYEATTTPPAAADAPATTPAP